MNIRDITIKGHQRGYTIHPKKARELMKTLEKEGHPEDKIWGIFIKRWETMDGERFLCSECYTSNIPCTIEYSTGMPVCAKCYEKMVYDRE